MQNFFGFLQIPAPAYGITEPLTDITSTQSFSKQFVRDPWFGRTDNNSTMTITLFTNATVIVLQDNSRSFKLEYPDVGLTNPENIARRNSTHFMGGLESGSSYIHFAWSLQGSQNNRYKFSSCWNLPSSADFKLKMGSDAAFRNSIFTLENGLQIDWSDAARQGFAVSSYIDPIDNRTTYARFNIQSNGCFDPSVVGSGSSLATKPESASHTEYASNRWWVFYCDGNNDGYRSSATGGSYSWGSFNSFSNWRCTSDNWIGVFWNGTHFHIAARNNTLGAPLLYKQCTPQSDGTLSCGSTTTVTSSQNGYVAIGVRNDGIPFVATRAAFISNKDYLYLYKANNHLGTSWSQAGSSEVLQDSGLSGVSMTNMSDSRIMIVSGRDNVRSRIFYKSNSSFGSLMTIETNSGNIAGKVLADKSGVAHVIYRLGGTSNIKYANYTNGPSWSSPRLISSNGATNFAVGMTIGPEKQSYVLFHYQTNKIVWNMTNSIGSFVASGVQDVSANAVTDYLTTSDYSNYTGYFGQLWVSSSNVVFHSFQITGWGTDITVMNSADFEWETHIASSPISNTLVSAAIKTNSTTHQCITNRSTDGGNTWSNPADIPRNNLSANRAQGDPAVAVNSTGSWYVVCLEYDLVNGKDRSIIYSTSSDGLTWTSELIKHVYGDPRLDKPWIAVDNNVTSPYKDNVYVCWSENSTSTSRIVFQRIGNSSTMTIYSRPLTYSTSGFQMSCNIAIGTNGEIYIAWFDLYSNYPVNGTVRMRYNTNGGLDSGWKNMTSTPPTWRRFLDYTNCFNSLADSRIRNWDCLKGTGTSYFRVTAMPSIAVDMKGGVHIIYAENRTGTSNSQGDIMYINSNNCRKNSASCTFSSPIVINRDSLDKDQFMPTIHVSNITSASNPRGTIYVTALDRRDDSSNINWKVWSYICAPGSSLGCTSSSDWSNMVVSDRSIHNHDGNFIGDYNGITHTKTREAYPIWIDDEDYSNKNFDVKGDWSKR